MRVRQLTPSGVGGVALVELSGRSAAAALGPLLGRPLPAPGRVRLATLRTPEGEPIDEVLIACAEAERFELGCHGGPAVVDAVVAVLVRVGAEPVGEESVAEARPGQRVAVEVEAGLARTTTELGARVLLGQDAAWAAALDGLTSDVSADPDAARDLLAALLATSRLGRGLLAPPRVVLCGPVNAGKSSLLNALVGRDRVLVSELPGTTRDAIEEPVEADGLPVRLIDTAGLRGSEDPVEAAGVERAERLAAAADARLVVVDLTAPDAGLELASETAPPCLVVGNKLDLVDPPPAIRVAVSARTGAGLDALRVELRRALVGEVSADGAVVFTPRQEGLVRGALRALERGDPGRAVTCLRAVRGD